MAAFNETSSLQLAEFFGLVFPGVRLNFQENGIARLAEGIDLWPQVSPVFTNRAFGLKLRKFPKEEIDRRGFTFDNPNAVKSCGCGSSFQA